MSIRPAKPLSAVRWAAQKIKLYGDATMLKEKIVRWSKITLIILAILTIIIFGINSFSPWIKCTINGGEMVKAGLSNMYGCFIRYPDAGKTCKNDSECKGVCVLPYDSLYLTPMPESGNCMEDNFLFGCRCYINYPDMRCSCID
jgi:hypothetical protein